MASYSVAQTKDHLSALIERAVAGEEVIITSRGKPKARIVPAEPETPKKDVRAATERLRQWRKEQGPTNLNIPLHRFYEWLYEDPED